VPSPDVVLVDPGCFTPWYDCNLGSALAARGRRVDWITSPPYFAPVPTPATIRETRLFYPLGSLASLRERHVARRAYKLLAYPRGLLRLDRWLRHRAQPGVLHVQWALFPPIDALFWRSWRRRGWSLVHTIHDVDALRGTLPAIPAGWVPRLGAAADAIIVHSRSERARAVDLGVPPERTHIAPQGTPGLFAGTPSSPEVARQKLGIPLDSAVILFFGLIKPYKGLGLLIDAFARVVARLPRAHLVIAGAALSGTEEILNRIAQADRPSLVHFLPGFVPLDQVSAYFAAADVVAIPYVEASSSAVLVQALTAGRPVVATSVGGLPELVVPGVTGLLVPPRDVDALADALLQILTTKDRGRGLGQAGREYALRRHDWSRIAKDTESIYGVAYAARFRDAG
jgi:glycosyltransferase involved in cell wall biosynthesis